MPMQQNHIKPYKTCKRTAMIIEQNTAGPKYQGNQKTPNQKEYM